MEGRMSTATRQKIEAAKKLVLGGMSITAAAKKVGLANATTTKYRALISGVKTDSSVAVVDLNQYSSSRNVYVIACQPNQLREVLEGLS